MKNNLILCVYILYAVNLFPADVESDVAYFMTTQQAFSISEEDARLLSVAAGIDAIFDYLHYDPVFKDMFLSAWAEAVIIDQYHAAAVGSGFRVSTKIKIDRNALLLAEPNYRNSMVIRLNDCDRILKRIEDTIAEAQIAEESSNVNTAYILHSQAADMCNELAILLEGLGDMSILSARGNSLQYFASRISGLSITIAQAMQRIEEQKESGNRDREGREIYESHLTLHTAMLSSESEYELLRKDQPYYEKSKMELAAIMNSCRDVLTNLDTCILPGYRLLSEGAQRIGDEYLLMRIRLDIGRIGYLEGRITELESFAMAEYTEPRLVRMEKERQKAVRAKKRKETLKQVLLHTPKDAFTLRFDLPAALNNGSLDTGSYSLVFTAERAFDGGVWARGVLSAHRRYIDGRFTGIGEGEASLGFWGNSLTGIGLAWQWKNDARYSDGEPENLIFQEPEFYPAIFWGKVDSGRNWPVFLARFRYGVALNADRVQDFLNGEITLILRAEDLLYFETSLFSVPRNKGLPVSEDSSHLSLVQGVVFTSGVRLPGPFLWGFTFSGTRYGSFQGTASGASFGSMHWAWTGFLQYSI